MKLEKDLERYCTICGYLISDTCQIAADVHGRYIDYNEKISGDITFCFCGECWAKINDNFDAGLTRARQRSEELSSSATTEKIIEEIEAEALEGDVGVTGQDL